ARLARRRVRARRSASPIAVERVLADVGRAAADLESRLARRLDPLAGARARADGRRSAAVAAVRAALGSDDDQVLHLARVAVKKLRYALESLLAADPDWDPRRLEPLI